MPIDNRDLVVEGARLTGSYKKQTFVCEVAKDGEGNLVFKVDGKEFKSPSAAGSHVMGGGAVNGWRFWSIEGEATTANVAADSGDKPAKPERKAKGPRKTPKSKVIRRMDEQPSDLEEGQIAWWCAACQARFIAGTETPEVCPEGHRADDPELTSAPEAVAAEQAAVEA
jgi:RAMA domain-containing protein